jgi:hypothetical protein
MTPSGAARKILTQRQNTHSSPLEQNAIPELSRRAFAVFLRQLNTTATDRAALPVPADRSRADAAWRVGKIAGARNRLSSNAAACCGQ